MQQLEIAIRVFPRRRRLCFVSLDPRDACSTSPQTRSYLPRLSVKGTGTVPVELQNGTRRLLRLLRLHRPRCPPVKRSLSNSYAAEKLTLPPSWNRSLLLGCRTTTVAVVVVVVGVFSLREESKV